MKRLLSFIFLVIFPPLFAEDQLTVQKAFEAALRRSESYAIREEEIKAAEGRYYQALGTVLPHLTASGSEIVQDTSGLNLGGDAFSSSFVRKSRPEVAITLTQPLFQGFREFKALSASRADRKKTELEVERARQLLFAEVVQLFLLTRELEEESSILISQKGVLERRIVELGGRIRLGKSRNSELLSAKSQDSLLEAEIARVQGQRSVAGETLNFLTGLSGEQKLALPEDPISPLESLENYLVRGGNRPDRTASQFAVQLSEAKLVSERAHYFPSLNLEANYYPYRVGFQDAIDWDLLFTLQFPLFEGGNSWGLVKEAKARLKQAELAESESGRRVELEIREAYHNLETSRNEVLALEKAEQNASKNYEAQNREYRSGLVNNLEVLQSLREWHEIRRQANRGRHRALLNAYRLKLAMGELPIELSKEHP